MGITKTDCTFLFYAKKLNVSFDKTCTLGRLKLYISREEIDACADKFRNAVKKPDAVAFSDAYSEPLFEILGAGKTDSLDFSSYESATIIHDLNIPVPASLYNSYSCVIDGGTLEHIFNFPVAIKNCMQMIRKGGHYIGMTPANNQMGHGFYQFSPELYYRVFSEENGFRMISMMVAVTGSDQPVWYEVADPAKVHNRVMLVNNFPLSLMFVAEKISDKEIFSTPPQQSDYVNTWNAFESLRTENPAKGESRLRYLYRKLLPYRVKVILRNIHDIYKKEKTDTPDLGVINPEYFKKTEL